ncbi:hypothetical protein PHMEG_0009722 [Phytophthora megakarya]|uniref:RxLR effector protein n=1 Tax=Phytophthora megakarya TaxID=4795 RepID=A0A225WFI0_9STRA|nr:hypothetical protein PHMEG_0009722 [Phytophthora megakarya]
MRISHILLTVVTVISVSFDVIAVVSDVEQKTSATLGNGVMNRFLRASKAIEEAGDGSGEDENYDTEDDEKRGLFDIIKNAPTKFLDDLAADLSSVRGTHKLIVDHNTEVFKVFAARKVTPKDMATEMAENLKTMSKAEIVEYREPANMLLDAYTAFWNLCKAAI